MGVFKFHKSRKGGMGVNFDYEQAPSTTIAAEQLCQFDAAGKLIKMGSQTARPEAVMKAPSTSTANGGERATTIDIGWGDTIWKHHFVPQLNGVIAQANGGSTSIIRVLSDGAYGANNWVGGQVYIKELDLVATITASSAPAGAGQNLDLTITSAINPKLVTTSGENGLFGPAGGLLPKDPAGMTIYATPIGRHVVAAQLIAGTFDAVSQLIAERTGGFAKVMGVHLEDWRNPYMLVCFTN